MLKTEEEAKECWCPFARYSSETREWMRASNRWVGAADSTSNPVPARCIASQCMAWRWVEEIWTGDTLTKPDPRGYCGLAGKP